MLAAVSVALTQSGSAKTEPNAHTSLARTASAVRSNSVRSFAAPSKSAVAAVRRVIFLDESRRPSLTSEMLPGRGRFRGVGRCGSIGSSFRGQRVIGCVVVYGAGGATVICGIKVGNRVVLAKDARMPCAASPGPRH
jgi:hypothetical protein